MPVKPSRSALRPASPPERSRKNISSTSPNALGVKARPFCAAAIGVASIARSKTRSSLIPILAVLLSQREPGGATVWVIVAFNGRLNLDIQQLRCGACNVFTLQLFEASSAPAPAFSKTWFQGLLKYLADSVDMVIIDAPLLDEDRDISFFSATAQPAVICSENISVLSVPYSKLRAGSRNLCPN